MKELVGECHTCGVNVYCLDGFLNGNMEENGQLTCSDCSLKGEKEGTDL